MYNDTITIFNRKITREGTVWYPTVAEGVQFSWDAAPAPSGYGWKRDDRATVLIPYVSTEGTALVAGKLYLPPKMWQRVEQPELYVTFADGEDFDFFLHGRWPEQEPVDDSGWPGGFYDHLCRTRDGVFAVSGVHRYNALPHFEVSGR